MKPWTLPAALVLGLASLPAAAQEEKSWTVVKCERYRAAWDGALSRLGRTGLSGEFLERHDAFLASGCTARAEVCPRSAEELRLANILVIQSMNAGAASTFAPFACRKQGG